MRAYSPKRYKNLPEHGKQRLAEYRKKNKTRIKRTDINKSWLMLFG